MLDKIGSEENDRPFGGVRSRILLPFTWTLALRILMVSQGFRAVCFLPILQVKSVQVQACCGRSLLSCLSPTFLPAREGLGGADLSHYLAVKPL